MAEVHLVRVRSIRLSRAFEEQSLARLQADQRGFARAMTLFAGWHGRWEVLVEVIMLWRGRRRMGVLQKEYVILSVPSVPDLFSLRLRWWGEGMKGGRWEGREMGRGFSLESKAEGVFYGFINGIH